MMIVKTCCLHDILSLSPRSIIIAIVYIKINMRHLNVFVCRTAQKEKIDAGKQ